jgi:hydroxypyruvate isomerase
VRPKFSANLGFLWKEFPTEQRIERAAATGFDAVEFHDEAQRNLAAPLARLLRRHGLAVEGLNTFMGASAGRAAIPGMEEKARGDIDLAIATAAALGARAVHVTAGIGPATPEAGAAYTGNLAYACNEAARHGLVILIEPVSSAAVPGYFLSSLDQAAETVARLDWPNLKLLFDCFHVHAMGHDLATAFAKHAPLIGHVQIAGIPGRNEPDRGVVDFPQLLRVFMALGYRGSFGCEYRPGGRIVEDGLKWMQAYD